MSGLQCCTEHRHSVPWSVRVTFYANIWKQNISINSSNLYRTRIFTVQAIKQYIMFGEQRLRCASQFKCEMLTGKWLVPPNTHYLLVIWNNINAFRRPPSPPNVLFKHWASSTDSDTFSSVTRPANYNSSYKINMFKQ